MNSQADNQASGNTPNGALHGIKVLDLTAVMLGPLATQILGDYGAEVIKVENISGDVMRANGTSRTRGMGSIFLNVNRNKKSIALDLKTDKGKEVLKRLIAASDVLVHNMRVDAIERLGFGYAAVSGIKNDIVYCAATGFGQSGPYANKPSLDDTILAECGFLGLGGAGGSRPEYPPTLLADKTAAMALVNATLAALLHKERTGRGQYVEVPMFETLVAYTLAEHLGGLTFEPALGKPGYARLMEGGRRVSPTSDGYVAILPYSGTHWIEFFKAAGRSDLLEKHSLADRHYVNANMDSLYASLAEITRQKTSAECLAVCGALDIPAAPINDIEDLIDHPHLKAVGLFSLSEHPTEGSVRYVMPPTRFSESPASIRSHAPLLGQHTREILSGLGLADDEIEALQSQGITSQSAR